MNLLSFEMKKIIKQKKYLWVLIAVLLLTSALFWMNSNQRSKLQGNWAMHGATSDVIPLEREWVRVQDILISKRDSEGLSYDEEKQLEYAREIGLALQRVRISTYFDRRDDINRFEERFLDNLQLYAEYGGEFKALDGIDREIAIAKNQWHIEHGIPYEYELSPVSQHLFLKQSTSLLLGIIGIAILIFFYGNTMVEEKENYTWQTIKTQPISKTKLVLIKYVNTLIMSLILILMVIISGLLIPVISQGWTLELNYPLIFTEGDSFRIITIGEYLIRSIVLFFCASSITIGISLLISQWVKRSISLYFTVGLVLVGGYIITSSVQSPLNPFYFYNLDAMHNSIDWLYALFAMFWTGMFLVATAYLPESETKNQFVKDHKPFIAGKTRVGSKLIHNIYLFEWRKLRRDGLLKILVLIVILITLGGHFFLSHQTKQREDAYLSELNWRIDAMHNNILVVEEKIEEYYEEMEKEEEARQGFEECPYSMDEDPDSWKYYYLDMIYYAEKYIKTTEETIAILENGLEAYGQEDWIPLYEYQLLVNEQAYNITYPGGGNIGAPETIREFTKLVSMHEKEILMDRNIKPVLSGEFIPTMHQHWSTQQRMGWRGEPVYREQWEYENKKVDNSGLFYLYLSFTHYVYLIPLLLLLVIVGGGMAREKGKKLTFNFLKTQPISEEKLYAGKLLTASIFTLMITLAIPILVVLVGTLLNRFGDWNYPVLHYNAYSAILDPEYTGLAAGGYGYNFMTVGRYLMHSAILFMVLSLLVIVTSNVLALFFKRSISVWAATITIFVGGFWFNGRNPLSMSRISPFTYFNIPKVVNGEIGAKLNSPGINVLTGVIVLLITAVVMGVLGYWIGNKKQAIGSTTVAIANSKIKGEVKK